MGLAQPKTEPLYTEEEYLAFERAAEERHEYLDGIIYAMAGESPDHGDISVNLVTEIAAFLKGKDCHTYTKDTKVRSGPLPKSRFHTKGLFSYPDLVVVCGERKYLDEYRDVLINPTVIVEVVSDATEQFDRQQKFLRYQQYLPSLVDYVLVSQNQPLVEVFHRPKPTSALWEYVAVSGLKKRVRIPALNCQLRLADIYYRVEFPPAIAARSNPAAQRARASKKAKSPKKKVTPRPATATKKNRKR